VVTNIEHDHPDCYPTPQDFYQAFRKFAGGLQPDGTLLGCADDPGAASLLADLAGSQRTLAYGLDAAPPAYRAASLALSPAGGFSFDFVAPAGGVTPVTLQVPGVHNLRNALAVLAVADLLGLPLQPAAQALGDYRGTGRRFELRGQAAGVTLVDDYAHHPTEIRATLSAARQRFPGRRLWAVWQPHTYSRTRTLFNEFATAFDEADQVLVTDIYAAREAPPSDGFSARQVVEAITRQKTAHDGSVPGVTFTPALAETSASAGSPQPGMCVGLGG
jgi:UDP-N-acetylmuramate--alanine ligase